MNMKLTVKFYTTRDFLRLGSPLNCRSVDEMFDGPKLVETSWTQNWPISRASSIDERKTPIQVENKLKTAGEAVPLTRVKCLVSMTTPKDARINGSAVTPAFVEFDMTTEGFGCLYLPSIAPQGPPTPSVVSGVVGVDSTVIGGIGTGKALHINFLFKWYKHKIFVCESICFFTLNLYWFWQMSMTFSIVELILES